MSIFLLFLLFGCRVCLAPTMLALAWDYGNLADIRFEVWASNQPEGFKLIGTTDTKAVPVAATEASQFFIVRASNTVTHTVSDWNQR